MPVEQGPEAGQWPLRVRASEEHDAVADGDGGRGLTVPGFEHAAEEPAERLHEHMVPHAVRAKRGAEARVDAGTRAARTRHLQRGSRAHTVHVAHAHRVERQRATVHGDVLAKGAGDEKRRFVGERHAQRGKVRRALYQHAALGTVGELGPGTRGLVPVVRSRHAKRCGRHRHRGHGRAPSARHGRAVGSAHRPPLKNKKTVRVTANVRKDVAVKLVGGGVAREQRHDARTGRRAGLGM